MSPPPSFMNCCKLSLCYDDEGNEVSITASCNLRDKLTGEIFEASETLDLRPLTEFITNQLIARHRELHGEVTTAGLGSFLQKAKSAAKSIVSSKAVKSVWDKVSPIAKTVLSNAVPGGAATMAVATKLADTVSNAKAGVPSAIAEIKAVASKALAGNPLAKELMGTAKTFSTMLDMKAGKDPTDIAHRVALIEQRTYPLLRGPSDAPPPPTDAIQRGFVKLATPSADAIQLSGYDIVGAAPSILHMPTMQKQAALARVKKAAVKKAALAKPREHRKPVATKARVPFVPMPRGGMVSRDHRAMSPPAPMARPSAPVASYDISEPEEMIEEAPYYDDAYYDDAYYDDTGEGEYYDVSGWKQWGYSRPYRSAEAALVDGDYGVSLSLRSLYANGLDLIKSRVGL